MTFDRLVLVVLFGCWGWFCASLSWRANDKAERDRRDDFRQLETRWKRR